MYDVFANPRYRGKHVILVDNKIYAAKTGAGASTILTEVRKKYPRQTPEVTFIPDADTLILWF